VSQKGFTGIELMAAIVVLGMVFGTMIALNGCAGMYPAPSAPACSKPEAAGSVICAIGSKIGSSPEQMNDMLLDVSLVGIGTKITTGAQMKEAVAKVQKFVNERPVLSISTIIAYLVTEAKIDPALALLLSRRLVFLQVPGLEIQTLTPFDVGLVKGHLANQLDQLAFF
jgi:hypothetical protein